MSRTPPTLSPKKAKECRKSIILKNLAQIRQRRRHQAEERFTTQRKKFVEDYPEHADAICDPELGCNALATSMRGAECSIATFTCKNCGTTSGLSFFLRTTCRRATSKMAKEDFVRKAGRGQPGVQKLRHTIMSGRSATDSGGSRARRLSGQRGL